MVIDVKVMVSLEQTAPSMLVTPNGTKLPLWAVSDDDLRELARRMGDAMVARAAEQRRMAMMPPSKG